MLQAAEAQKTGLAVHVMHGTSQERKAAVRGLAGGLEAHLRLNLKCRGRSRRRLVDLLRPWSLYVFISLLA